jgi:hypothetical protein
MESVASEAVSCRLTGEDARAPHWAFTGIKISVRTADIDYSVGYGGRRKSHPFWWQIPFDRTAFGTPAAS